MTETLRESIRRLRCCHLDQATGAVTSALRSSLQQSGSTRLTAGSATKQVPTGGQALASAFRASQDTTHTYAAARQQAKAGPRPARSWPRPAGSRCCPPAQHFSGLFGRVGVLETRGSRCMRSRHPEHRHCAVGRPRCPAASWTRTVTQQSDDHTPQIRLRSRRAIGTFTFRYVGGPTEAGDGDCRPVQSG
jgi:hypothetical protein